MKTGEIILITLMVIGAFLVADTITDQLAIEGLFRRWAVNAVLQTQFYAVIYLLFDYRDTVRKLEENDHHDEISGADNDTDGLHG